MRTEQLIYLLETSRYGSINSASEQLNITAAALSLSLKSLEDEMGVLLLDRTRRGVRLTETGQKLVDCANVFLAQIEQLKGTDKPDISAVSGTLSFFTGQNALDLFLPQMICAFYETYPNVEVQPIVAPLKTSLRQLRTAKEDFILSYDLYTNDRIRQDTFFDPTQFEFHPLSQGSVYCVAHPKLAITNYKSLSYKTLIQYPLLFYQAESFEYTIIDTLSALGKPDKITLLNNQAIYQEMLDSGKGVGLTVLLPLKHFFLSKNSDLKYIPIRSAHQTSTFQFGYIFCREKPLTELSQLFIKALKQYLDMNSIT